jgi:heptose I phosphotransferase
MFWMDPEHHAIFTAAAADSYDSLARLRPADHYVEKQGRSTGRYVIQAPVGSVRFFLKKYYTLSWWQRWFLPLEEYPGPREWANIERVAALGIPVPRALAAGARSEGECHSLLAVRELEGYQPLHQVIPRRFGGQDTLPVRQLRRQLTYRLAEIVRRLHDAQLYHCDLYLCHFFLHDQPAIDGEGPTEHLVLIDFTRLRHSNISRWRVKDLAQLLFSSDLPGITRSDRMRFFKHYLRVSRLDATARRLLRRVQRKALLYHRHNQSLMRQAA